MVTDRSDVAITNTRLVHLHLTMSHSKGQNQGHAYFDSTDWVNITNAIK